MSNKHENIYPLWQRVIAVVGLAVVIFIILIFKDMYKDGFGDSSSSLGSWIKHEEKDNFSDKGSLVYLLKQPGKSSKDPLLGIDCLYNKTIRVHLMVDSKAPAWDGVDLAVLVRINDGEITEENWKWLGSGPYIVPPDKEGFLRRLNNGSKVALRVKAAGLDAAFDITGVNTVIKNVKKYCKQ